MITTNTLNGFLLIILGILLGIVIVYIYIGESDTLPRIKKRLKQYKEKYQILSGTVPIETENGFQLLNYRLETFDGGLNWYAIDLRNSDRVIILGEAEKIYPGLRFYLSSLKMVESNVLEKRKIDVSHILRLEPYRKEIKDLSSLKDDK